MGFDGIYRDGKWIVSISREKNLVVEEWGELYEVQCVGMNGNILVDKVFFMAPISEEEVWELIWRLRLEEIDRKLTVEESGLNYKNWFDGFDLYESEMLFGGSCLWRRAIGDVVIHIAILGKGRNLMYERREDSLFEIWIYARDSKIRANIQNSSAFSISHSYDPNNVNIISGDPSENANNSMYCFNYDSLPCYYRGYISYYIVLEIIDMFIREYGGIKEKIKYFLKGQAP